VEGTELYQQPDEAYAEACKQIELECKKKNAGEPAAAPPSTEPLQTAPLKR
jgi:hypothetical protein